MTPRRRLGTAMAGLAVLAGIVVALRHAQSDSPPDPVLVPDFSAPYLLVTGPREPPSAPDEVAALGDPARIRVAWGSALPGRADPSGAAGYEVTWHRDGEEPRTRVVASPEVDLEGLAAGTDYRIGVRTVDAIGRRSPWTDVVGRTGNDGDWRGGLTGLLDDFDDPASTDPRRTGSLWHLDGYRGCVNTGTAGGRLVVEMNCGADSAVLRARRPLVLSDVDGVLGRVGVITDAAGSRGLLTVDLVPGGPDQIGSNEVADPALPPGALRVVVGDAGARVLTGPDVPTVADPSSSGSPRRGTGVLHRIDVLVTTTGVRVLQDGGEIGSSGAVPAWREATVLIGVRGPQGRESRVRLDAAGFSGPRRDVRTVVEVPTTPATQEVLDVQDPAPGIGVSRAPLRGAAAARLRATVAFAGPADPAALVVQLGDRRIPAVATAAPPVVDGVARLGAAVTVVAEVPPDLLTAEGPDSLTPFVLRMPGAHAAKGTVRSSYLEVDSTVDGSPSPQAAPGGPGRADEPPTGSVEVRDQDDRPVPLDVPLGARRVVLAISLDGIAAEGATGAEAGAAGFQRRIDGRLAASVPTAREGPGVGGEYTVGLELGKLGTGKHTIELRVIPADPAGVERSTLVRLVS
ncbi:MAG: fibronectin type III domain-containing protein [Umezawaea sp.]